MGGFVLQIPVQPIVMMFGFSGVPQDTIAGGTGERSVPPFQNIFDIIFPFMIKSEFICFLTYALFVLIKYPSCTTAKVAMMQIKLPL